MCELCPAEYAHHQHAPGTVIVAGKEYPSMDALAEAASALAAKSALDPQPSGPPTEAGLNAYVVSKGYSPDVAQALLSGDYRDQIIAEYEAVAKGV